MSSSGEVPFAIHNPALLPAEVLLGEFTARGPLLTTLLRLVRQNLRGKPPQHVVLVGARGMGKTTTLWAVAHSIMRDPKLAVQWHPVVFDEESRRVGDLADFWLEAIRQWELATHSSQGRAEQLLETADDDLEARARSEFLTAVDRSGRRAVLLIDNLNEVFASISEPEALHRLRAFLMEDDRVMILGAATRHFEEITGLDEPFFDFFRIFELVPLTFEEMQETLRALAERRGDQRVLETIAQRPGTIRSLHVLTGGNPRLVKTFYRLLAEGLRGDVRQDLERLVDEFTPYFKAILDALPTQQQRIIDAVALAWEPVEVAAVARATRLPSNQVSAQLRNLVRCGIAAEAAGSPKRKTYLLADRFSNIHYLMRHGRTARRRFDWFVLTLRALFPDPDQADALARVAGRTAGAGAEGIRDTRDLLSSAFLSAPDEDSRRRILHATIKETWDQDTLSKFDEWLDMDLVKQHLPASSGEMDIVEFFGGFPTEVRRGLGYAPDDAAWWFSLTEVLSEKEAWVLTEAACRKALALDPTFASAWNRLAIILARMERVVEAEAAFRRAIELDPKGIYARRKLGNLLERQGRFSEAEVFFLDAIEIDPKYTNAWNDLGVLLADSGRYDEAEDAYRRAIELDSKRINAFGNLGNLLRQMGRLSEAEVRFREAVNLDPTDSRAWDGLGTLLGTASRHDEAEAAFRKAVELDSKNANAWSNLGILQRRMGRVTEADASFQKAIELNARFAAPYSILAQLCSSSPKMNEEARALAVRGLTVEPSDVFAQRVFTTLCNDDAPSWQVVLPSMTAWFAAHPKDTAVFDFTMNGFIRYAQLTSPAEAAKVLGEGPDSQPFETLRDAFRAHDDREHLHRLAPERRTLVLEVLDRISVARPAGKRKRAGKRAVPKPG